jgi:hypothetical protein
VLCAEGPVRRAGRSISGEATQVKSWVDPYCAIVLLDPKPMLR